MCVIVVMLIVNYGVLTFFWWWFYPFLKGGVEYKLYFLAEKPFRTQSMQHVSKHANHVLKSSLLTQRKGRQVDFLLEKLFLKTLNVWNGNCKMKRNVIFVGWSNQNIFSWKKCWIRKCFSNTQNLNMSS
jgi:hypothetical protein